MRANAVIHSFKEGESSVPRLAARSNFLLTPVSACAIAQKCYPDDNDAVLAGLYHICLDEMCSDDPFFKADLGVLVEIDALEKGKTGKRRRSKKRKKKKSCASSKRKKKQSSDPLEEFSSFLNKVEQVRKLRRALMK